MTNRYEQLSSVLEKLTPRDRTFATSLLDQWAQRGSLSDKQMHWVGVLIERGTSEPKPKPTTISLPKILEVFGNTEGRLKYPKLWLDTDGVVIRLSKAGGNARFPGSINVTNGVRYGDPDSKFYGRIHTDGNFEPGRDHTADVSRVLVRFNDNPTDFATTYGHKTGNCCFCGRQLTDPRSVGVGYGPVCADNWGLPWGSKGNPVEEWVQLKNEHAEVERQQEEAAFMSDPDFRAGG